MASATYDPLAPGSIRLIRFENSTETSVCMSIHNFVLREGCPPYQALSYTWDAPFHNLKSTEDYSETRNVHVVRSDNLRYQVAVKKNLYEALQQLRTQELGGYLWADALCIDQTNEQERTTQVMMMGQLFSKADRIIAWLGRGDENSHVVADHLNRTWTLMEPCLASLEATYFTDAISTIWKSDEVVETGEWREKWTAVAAFYINCRYFTRVWIAQEIVLAKEIQFFYGIHRVSFEALVSVSKLCRLSELLKYFTIAEGFTLTTKSGFGVELEWLFTLRNARIQGGPDSESMIAFLDRVYGARTPKSRRYAYFEWNLSYSKRLGATLAQDNIFAMLGLLSKYWTPDLEEVMVPDYTIPSRTVFTDVVKYLLKVSPCLTILSLVEDLLVRRDQDAQAPSWVPNFKAPYVAEVSHLWFSQRLDCLQGLVPLPSYRRIEDARLRLSGWRFDIVADISASMVDESFARESTTIFDTPAVLQFFVSHLRFLYKLDEKYHNGQSKLEALVSLLLADIDCTSHEHNMLGMFLQMLLGTLGESQVLSEASPSEKWTSASQSCLEEAFRLLGDIKGVPELPKQEDVKVISRILRLDEDQITPEDAERLELAMAAESWFGLTIARIMYSRRSFLTASKLLGLGLFSTQVGDEVWLLHEGRVPYVLRPTGEAGQYILVGEAYIHGFMQGEAVKAIEIHDRKEISLV